MEEIEEERERISSPWEIVEKKKARGHKNSISSFLFCSDLTAIGFLNPFNKI